METEASLQPTPDPAPEPAKSGADVWIPRVVGAVAGVPVVLGVVKAILETSTGSSFSVSDAAYYVGWAALGSIIGAWWGAMAAGALNWLLTEVFGQDEDQNESIVIGVAIAVFALLAILFPLSADPPADDSGTGWRILGIVTVIGGGVAYAALVGSSKKQS